MMRRFGAVRAVLSRFLLLPCLALPLLQWDNPAVAQAKDGQVFQDWGIRCIKDPENPQAQFCTAQHAAVNNQTQKTVMAINVGFPPDGSPARATIVVPLVVLLEPGISVQVDEREPVVFPFELCKPSGCEVQITLDQALYSMLSTGAGGKVTIQVPPGRNVVVPFSLKGFTAALTALK